ncbi:dimethyl sulfoxide reductase anchor subunit family protein [Curtanaerobium respiraculi]|uniref:dimethyl sulfoxide reductase anchor subunit family protein n=1 Tax=Curtanaerobium respiraculi TaxID=2949669 RepID=UPI0024B373E6|nr:DmsC/YnfH family molybdoenzyme membrane anchor subunit [Curtanaerobium respiraculi]
MELQWPLILFTAFMAWSAGVFGAQGIYALRGEAKQAQMPALIVSIVLLAVGGIAVFMHLQHWERIFNGFGHITSGITQELIAIVAMFVIMVIFFVMLRRSGEDASVPRWVAILAIASAAVLVVICGHSYMMASRPAWNSILQVGSILGAACALGPATMALIASVKGADGSPENGKANTIGQIINAALAVLFVGALSMVGGAFTDVEYYFDPTSPLSGLRDATALSPFAATPSWSPCSPSRARQRAPSALSWVKSKATGRYGAPSASPPPSPPPSACGCCSTRWVQACTRSTTPNAVRFGSNRMARTARLSNRAGRLRAWPFPCGGSPRFRNPMS